MSPTTHRAARLTLASLILTALGAQLLIGMIDHGLTAVRFFSFFTVLSNLLAAVMLAAMAFRPGIDTSPRFGSFRGAVTVYMSVTGLVYAVILAPGLADVAVPEPWIDWIIHILAPVAVAADWILYPPRRHLPLSVFVPWLAFPAVYLGYSLVRGPIVDWYPYPFLDPGETAGYGEVAMWSLVVLVVILGFSLAYRWWVNRIQTRLQSA